MSDVLPLKRSNFSGPSEDIEVQPLTFDLEELDDEEYHIPKINELPSLESILNENADQLSLDENDSVFAGTGVSSVLGLGTEGSSDTLSLASQRSRSSGDKKKAGSTAVLRHVLLKGISTQLSSASERVDAGSATAVAFNTMVAVGTSHGLTLVFDSRQSLRWCLSDPGCDQGSVSSLSFNADSTRLLVGFARGNILMFDLSNGKLLRTMTDVHPPGTAVLSLKFTDLPTLALCSDSGGSVFELSFKRTLGVRGCDTKCLFSGSRGEVCVMAPLLLNDLHHRLRGAVIVAMATLSKVIIVSIRPKLRVIFVRPLPPGSSSLPLMAWQFVVIQVGSSGKVVDPVLACAKADSINFYQISVDPDGKLKVTALQKLVVSYTLLAVHWLNSWTLALVDTSERLHLLDIHSHEELESSDISNVGLVYESSHFKGIATGGNVSLAMARAGSKACYNTVICHGGQMLVLGAKSLHAMTIRPWTERLSHLVKQKKYSVALSLGLSFFEDTKAVTGVNGSREKRKEAVKKQVIHILEQFSEDMTTPEDDIPTIVQYSVSLRALDVIFTKLWDAVFLDSKMKYIYLNALEEYILNEQLSSIGLPPIILQQFVQCYESSGKFQALEACILHLDVLSLDLHQVTQICRANALYDAIIYIQNKAFGDYVSPIHDLVPILQDALSADNELTGKEVELGNKMLVYVSCCLAGRGYPAGEIPRDVVQTVKHDVFKSLTAAHSMTAGDSELQYPYLRTLLHFDTREFLNVVSLAFTEPEFTTELGLMQRQRLVDILIQVMVNSPGFSASEVGALFTFLARQLSRPTSGLQIQPEMFHPVFEFLTDPNPAHRGERQQTLLELLRAAGLQNYPKDVLLSRAKEAGFFRVCEVIYEQTGEWDQVFSCYLEDSRRRPQVFSFLRNIFLLYRNPGDVQSLLDTVCARVLDLLAVDINLTANIIATHLLDRVPKILEIASDERTKWTLLNAILYSRSDINEQISRLGKRYIGLFLSLSMKLERNQIVEILERLADVYEVEHAKEIAEAFEHFEGLAYLLEKQGDFNGAFQVLITRLQSLLSRNDIGDISEIENLVKAALLKIQGPHLQKTDDDRDQLWKTLLDTFLQQQHSMTDTDKSRILQTILTGTIGYSNPSVILNFLLRHSAYSGAKFGHLRHLFTGMLENSRYEETLATICLRLVNSDLHTQLSSQLRSVRRAVRPFHLICSICGRSFQDNSVILFPCGHPVHEQCSATCQCPVCSTIGLDSIASQQPPSGRRKSNSEGRPTNALPDLGLKLSAPPVPDLERLFQ